MTGSNFNFFGSSSSTSWFDTGLKISFKHLCLTSCRLRPILTSMMRFLKIQRRLCWVLVRLGSFSTFCFGESFLLLFSHASIRNLSTGILDWMFFFGDWILHARYFLSFTMRITFWFESSVSLPNWIVAAFVASSNEGNYYNLWKAFAALSFLSVLIHIMPLYKSYGF